MGYFVKQIDKILKTDTVCQDLLDIGCLPLEESSTINKEDIVIYIGMGRITVTDYFASNSSRPKDYFVGPTVGGEDEGIIQCWSGSNIMAINDTGRKDEIAQKILAHIQSFESRREVVTEITNEVLF